MYSGDEYYDDEITSGPIERYVCLNCGCDESCHRDADGTITDAGKCGCQSYSPEVTD